MDLFRIHSTYNYECSWLKYNNKVLFLSSGGKHSLNKSQSCSKRKDFLRRKVKIINIFSSYLKLYTTMSIPKLASLSELVSFVIC